MDRSDTYIIQGGREGADRLAVLAAAMWPYTNPFLQRAGLREGMKCLDVGCGNGEVTGRIGEIVGRAGQVLGIDFDPSVIRIAQQQKGELESVDFKVLNIATQDLDERGFDFIFCRFILSHLQNPQEVLGKLFQALKQGGILAVEDVDFKGHFCHPPSKAFDQYVKWYTEVGLRKGANPNIGPALVNLIHAEGFQHIKLHVALPTFMEGDGKRLGLLTLNAIRESILDEGLATTEEVEQVINELEEFTRFEFSMMSLPRIFQVAGTRAEKAEE